MNKNTIAVVTVVFVAIVVFFLFESTYSVADSEKTIDVEVSHGHIVNVSDGSDYGGGVFSGELELKFVADNGYELVYWEVDGDMDYEVRASTIIIKSVLGNTKVTPIVRNYSTSNNLIDTVYVSDLAKPGDSIMLGWSFRSSDLSRIGGTWYGMPSTPLIVENSVYVRAAGVLYKLDISTGIVQRSVESVGDPVSFYHYLSYGNGVIFDTVAHRAYDLDLNYLYELPSSLKFATYYDGFFYGCLQTDSGYQMFKTTADIDSNLDNSVKVNVFTNKDSYNIFGQYGQFSSFIIENGWIFFLEANLSGKERSISAYNTITEEYRTIDLTPLIGGMYWDDGWLTYYQGYLYVTTYVGGLFGGVPEQYVNQHSMITWVKFNYDLKNFEMPRSIDIETTSGSTFQGIASGFVIHNGRGYVNVRSLGTDTTGGSNDTGTSMVAYNIGLDGTPLVSQYAPSVMTHGGIVLNAAHESDGVLYVYLIPYNSVSQGIYVFTDELVDGEWVLKDNYDKLDTDPSRREYCSQGIRVGPNGEIIYFLDTGNVDCYVLPSKYSISITIMDGEYAITKYGSGESAGEVIASLYPVAQFNEGVVVLGEKSYSIYGLNGGRQSWESVSNPFIEMSTSVTSDHGVITSYYRHIILLNTADTKHFYDKPESAEGWYYYSDGDYHKCVLYDIDSFEKAPAVLIYSTSKPETNELHLPSTVIMVVGDTESLNIPVEYLPSFKLKGDSVSIVVDYGLLKVSGIYEGITLLTFSTADVDYSICFNVLPKTYLDSDGNEVIDSLTHTIDEGGFVNIISSHTVKGSIITTISSESICKDMNGIEIEKTMIFHTIDKQGSIGENGQYIATEIIEEQCYRMGTLVKDTSYYGETSTNKTINGVVTVTKVMALTDHLTDITIITTRVEKTESSFVSVCEKNEMFNGEDTAPYSTEETYDIVGKDDSIIFLIDKDQIVVELSNTLTGLDMTAIVSELGSNAQGMDVIYKTDGLVKEDVLDSISKANSSLVMSLDTAQIEIPHKSVINLINRGDLSFNSHYFNQLTSKQQLSAGEAKVFSIVLRCGDVEQHDFGTFTMSIACDIDIQEGKELKVWRIDDYGKKTYASNVTYSNGIVTFDGDHLSIYAIGYESESSQDEQSNEGSGGNGVDFLLFGGIGAVAIIVLFGGMMIIRGRH